MLVFSTGRFPFEEEETFAFSIPSNTKGLRFICRDTFIGGESSFDHPLSSRYEEMDSIVVFDNVMIPWERVFYYKNAEAAGNFSSQSAFHHFAKHQALTRQIVKGEFILGVAELLVQTINVKEYLHIQEKCRKLLSGWKQ